MNSGVRAGLAALAVVVVSLLVVSFATGGDPEGISKVEYLVAAQGICSGGNEGVVTGSEDETAGGQPLDTQSDEQLGSFVRGTVVPRIRDQVVRLRALQAPAGEEAHLGEIYDAVERGITQIEADPKKYTADENPFGEAEELGEKYGFAVCAAQRN